MQKRPCHGVHDIYPVEQEGGTLPLPEMQIQAYKDEQRDKKVLQWTYSFQFPTHPVTQTIQTNPRKRASGKLEPDCLLKQGITLQRQKGLTLWTYQ